MEIAPSRNSSSQPVKKVNLFPINISSKTIMDKVVAGVAGAIVAFPLSIGFALIAGVPSEVMIVASIYAAFINAIFASSNYGVGGPNTAVALITGAAVAPFAPREGDLYLGYVFVLCLLVGIIQLLTSLLLRKVDIMDYVSTTVIDGLTMGIGGIFILSSLNWAVGLAPDINAQWIIFDAFTSFVNLTEGMANGYAMLVSGSTILTGLICWQFKTVKNFAILFAITVGFLVSNILDANFHTRIDQIGWLSLNLFETSLPDLRPVSWQVAMELIGPAVAIALIGTLQTLSIAKALRKKGEKYNPSQEAFSQGFQHIFMGFFHGCPVSNSFNKSALQRSLNGNKWSFIVSALFTILLVMWFGSVVAAIPMPALAGCMILVGLSMLNPWKHREYFKSGVTIFLVFAVSAVSAIALSIMAAIFIGALLSIVLHFVKFATPDASIVEKNNELSIKIVGPYFYVSGAKINKIIERELDRMDLEKVKRVNIDLQDAMILTRDQIDNDWLHRLLHEEIPITVNAAKTQKRQIRILQQRGALPDTCEVMYPNTDAIYRAMIERSKSDRRKATLAPYGGTDSKVPERRKAERRVLEPA